MMMMIVEILCPVLPAFCSRAYATRDDVQIILYDDLSEASFRSIGKMGSETRALSRVNVSCFVLSRG